MNTVDVLKAELTDLEFIANRGNWTQSAISVAVEQMLFPRHTHGILVNYDIFWTVKGVCTVEFELPNDNVLYSGDLRFTHLGGGLGHKADTSVNDAYDRAMKGI